MGLEEDMINPCRLVGHEDTRELLSLAAGDDTTEDARSSSSLFGYVSRCEKSQEKQQKTRSLLCI